MRASTRTRSSEAPLGSVADVRDDAGRGRAGRRRRRAQAHRACRQRRGRHALDRMGRPRLQRRGQRPRRVRLHVQPSSRGTRKKRFFEKDPKYESMVISPNALGRGFNEETEKRRRKCPHCSGVQHPQRAGAARKRPTWRQPARPRQKRRRKPTKSRPEWPVNYEREIACEQACRSGVSDHPRRRRHRSRGNGARREYRKSASLGQAAGSTASTTRCERGPANPCASTRIAAAETQKQRPAQRPQDTEQVAPRHDSWPDPRRTRQRRPVMIR